jgi:TM2 domain-containing membrane protein YozV
MANANPGSDGSGQPTIYCPQCGKAMRVAREHFHTPVACPYCQETIDPWRLAAAMPGAAVPPPLPVHAYGPPAGLPYFSSRNRWVAGALGVLLGEFGVHRFYLGFIGIGIIQIVVTVVTCGIGGIWGFIEGILCFCGAMRDVDGLPLRS